MERGQKTTAGRVLLLLDHIGVRHVAHEQVTVALWRHLQSLTIAVEGELKTRDGRLMGRLDLLFAGVDDQGEMQGWIVADLKTGNAPTNTLKPEVNRQLRMYRDILLANNPDAPRFVQKDGTPRRSPDGQPKATTCWSRPTLLGKRPSRPPCPWTPRQDQTVAEVFATGKRGVHTGGHGANLRVLYIKGILWTQWCWFTATNQQPAPQFLELCEPLDESGRAIPTGQQLAARFDGRGKEALEALQETGHQGPMFLGS